MKGCVTIVFRGHIFSGNPELELRATFVDATIPGDVTPVPWFHGMMPWLFGAVGLAGLDALRREDGRARSRKAQGD